MKVSLDPPETGKSLTPIPSQKVYWLESHLDRKVKGSESHRGSLPDPWRGHESKGENYDGMGRGLYSRLYCIRQLKGSPPFPHRGGGGGIVHFLVDSIENNLGLGCPRSIFFLLWSLDRDPLGVQARAEKYFHPSDTPLKLLTPKIGQNSHFGLLGTTPPDNPKYLPWSNFALRGSIESSNTRLIKQNPS